MPSLAHKRGSRAQINAAALAGGLKAGEVYLISDEARLTVGTSASGHQAMAKQGEGGGSDPWVWTKLAADVTNSTITPVIVPGLSFAALANTAYLVEFMGTFTSPVSTTGIAVSLDIPSGSVSGLATHMTSATGLSGNDQIADAVTPAASTGVRLAGSNTPISGRFIVAVGAAGGTVQLQFRSEVAASAVTMKAGITAMGVRAI
jgi:hypothetical protein